MLAWVPVWFVLVAPPHEVSLAPASACAPRQALAQELGQLGTSLVDRTLLQVRLTPSGETVELVLLRGGEVALRRVLHGRCEDVAAAVAVVVDRYQRELGTIARDGPDAGAVNSALSSTTLPPAPRVPSAARALPPTPYAASPNFGAPGPVIGPGSASAAPPVRGDKVSAAVRRVVGEAPSTGSALVSAPRLANGTGTPEPPAPALPSPAQNANEGVSSDAQAPARAASPVEPPLPLSPARVSGPTPALIPAKQPAASEQADPAPARWAMLVGGGVLTPAPNAPAAPVVSLEPQVLLLDHWRVSLLALFSFGGTVEVVEKGVTRGTATTRDLLALPSVAWCTDARWSLCGSLQGGLRLTFAHAAGPLIFQTKPGLSATFAGGASAELTLSTGPLRLALIATVLLNPLPASVELDGLPVVSTTPVVEGLLRLSIGAGTPRSNP
jgi:hypothetical protein